MEQCLSLKIVVHIGGFINIYLQYILGTLMGGVAYRKENGEKTSKFKKTK